MTMTVSLVALFQEASPLLLSLFQASITLDLADTLPASLLLIPVTVLSISSWTRFLTPGVGYTLPDLGCSVSLCSQPVLNLYVVHKSETFKVVIPISAHAMSNIQGTSNPVLDTDAVAMKFDLAPASAHYMGWHSDGVCGGSWQHVGDFTSGEAGNGGKVEITGQKGVSRGV